MDFSRFASGVAAPRPGLQIGGPFRGPCSLRRTRHRGGAGGNLMVASALRGSCGLLYSSTAPNRALRLPRCQGNDSLAYVDGPLEGTKGSPAADTSGSAAAAAEDKPPPVQKIDKLEAEKDDDGEKTLAPAAPPPKSNLKKPNCGADGDACPPKGNVKWLDLLGKDLTEVKEFEPSESGDSMDDGDGMSGCVCVIQ